MRSLLTLACVLMMLAVSMTSAMLVASNNKNIVAGHRRVSDVKKTKKNVGDQSFTSCADSPGTAAFDQLLDAAADHNITAVTDLLADDFVYQLPSQNILYNRSSFITYLNTVWAGKGIDFLWPSDRYTSDNTGVAIVRYGGFQTTTPNAPIENAELLMFYQTDNSYAKIRLFTELIRTTEAHKTHQHIVTEQAYTNVIDAFTSANGTALSAAFSSAPTIFELDCGADSVAPITKYEFIKKATAEYATQITGHLHKHKTFINGVFGAVQATAYITRNSASGDAAQVLSEVLTVYSVNTLGHIGQFFSFRKIWYG